MNIKIYGFGSFFQGAETFNDIDLLIIHDSNDYTSCLDAISLKMELISKFDNAHITMLSNSEEFQLNFIEKSEAFLIGFYFQVEKEDIVSEIEFKIKNMLNRHG
ncbi:TPA: hypothetical protein I4D15_23040 [Enterobacter bugandensis]|uniref:hypothetical protein n=1 Tax=Enterobacter TaxID=547 RepID=UPI0005ECAAC8|nr:MULTISPECIES: hypothetical protein [Enterobacter]HDU2748899.1 hypothetical protein [Klebsiella pneumoniae]KJN35751.1 hypothetical protein SS14_02460 [Enterobacter bugandensis]MCW5103502.1 hypothetical protein [Enterobacter hormaechei subsp. hoffmannii]HAS1313044.1 hypothetical protein [Enterobacter bugandensis]HCD1867661.1 hypothetical protein [Enterobacter bugandensis]